MEIAALIVGALGVITGGIALIYAHLTHRVGQQSQEVAERAEQLAAAADTLSREANRLAIEANELGEEANTIARRVESRETERNDVRWELSRQEPGIYHLVNVGRDEALEVHATVSVDEEDVERGADLVPSGGHVVFNFPGAAAEYQREVFERARSAKSSFDPSKIMRELGYSRHSFREHITWRTPRGKYSTHEPNPTFGEL